MNKDTVTMVFLVGVIVLVLVGIDWRFGLAYVLHLVLECYLATYRRFKVDLETQVRPSVKDSI